MSLISREKWEKLGRKKNLEGTGALKAVMEAGLNLCFVKDQTYEICLEAVNENSWALKYVKDQTHEICLAAVKEEPEALQFVEERFLDGPKDTTPEEVTLNGVKYRKVEP